MTHQVTDEQPDDAGTTPADAAREALATIRKGWRYVLDPIRVETAGSMPGIAIRPATEDEIDFAPDARLDTPVTLAFWVHAALDEWPTILQTLEPVDPAKPDGKLHLVTTRTVDCADVLAMVDLLSVEAERIATWTDELGHDFGHRFVAELQALARAVARVAWPPKGDRMTIGDCPECGRRLRVKAPEWRRAALFVPVPSTDPTSYADWTRFTPEDAEWEPDRDQPITCRCGAEDTLEGWRERLAGPSEPMTAPEIVAMLRQRLGMRFESAAVVRQWARRGLISKLDAHSDDGHALYDPVQVMAALINREKQRDAAS